MYVVKHDSDSDDADFVPEAPDSDLSEEDDNGDAAKGENGILKGKRKKVQKKKGRRKKRRAGSEDEDSYDDDDDEDFTGSLSNNNEAGNDKTEVADEEEEKRRTDRLYSDFLSGVEDITKRRTSESSNQETIITTKKIYDFAGERVEVEEKVPASSIKPSSSLSSSSKKPESGDKSNVTNGCNGLTPSTSKSTSSAAPGLPIRTRVSILSSNPAQIALASKPGARKGLSAVLNAIQSNKKQKMGTLEKTKLDWQAFKKDKGIEDELKTHVKSKDGYVDRQEFLQRTDLRQFEIEKNLRARQRRNN
ncbi:unnamed protein product [Allacma fusca]|uniref:Craniofacial development protein 1 n=1 Tax=Allacma fusca TaxID=39272 RepID=A0A8J2LQ83_9HEXA|nr:unnamed protein product [Allacma fusca]